MRIIPGRAVYVGRTAGEADEFYDELQALIAPELKVPYLLQFCETDVEVSARRADADLSGGVLGIASFRNLIVEMAKRDKLTVRQTYEKVLPSMGHVTMKWNAQAGLRRDEAWYTEKGCDGFNTTTPVMPTA